MTQYQSKYSDESENQETIYESQKLYNPKRIVATTGEPEIESNPKDEIPLSSQGSRNLLNISYLGSF